MKKLLLMTFYFCLAIAYSADGFAENMSDEDSDYHIAQDEIICENDTLLKEAPRIDDLLQGMKKSFSSSGEELIETMSEIWISDDANDLKPLMGTEWMFGYEMNAIFFDKIYFQESVLSSSDGVMLICEDEHGNPGGTFYADLPYGVRGFVVTIPADSVEKLYFFTINGEKATGLFRQGNMTTGLYSNYVDLTGARISGPSSEPEPKSSFKYYVPYFMSDATHATGIGLANLNGSKAASAEISIYNNQGALIGSQSKNIPARGQDAFTLGVMSDGEGWVLIESDEPLGGLCFLANIAIQNYMADIPMSSESDAQTEQIVPHVAQNKTWDTIIFICNPNSLSAQLTLNFVDSSGNLRHSKTYAISAMGCGKFDLSNLVSGNSYANGRVEISSSRPVAAFALYYDLKSGGMNYAGICAISSTDGD